MKRQFAKASVLFLFVFAVVGLCLHNVSCVKATDDALSKIGEAGNNLQQAFEAVLDAEKAGANVSRLTDVLNEAGRLLMEAEIAYRSGNLSEAASKANASFLTGETVKGEALDLKGSALKEGQKVLWLNSVFSLAGGITLIVGLVFVWSYFKRVYSKRLLDLKPEVVSSAEA